MNEVVWKGNKAILPVRLGQEVWTNLTMSGWYFRSKDRPYTAKVVYIGLGESERMGGGSFNVEFRDGKFMMQFDFSQIGKTVFLTQKEAMDDLKRRVSQT